MKIRCKKHKASIQNVRTELEAARKRLAAERNVSDIFVFILLIINFYIRMYEVTRKISKNILTGYCYLLIIVERPWVQEMHGQMHPN